MTAALKRRHFSWRVRLLLAAGLALLCWLLAGTAFASDCPPDDPSRSDCAAAATAAQNPLVPIAGGLAGTVAGGLAGNKLKKGEKEECRDRVQAVHGAVAEYKRYDQMIDGIRAEIESISQGRNIIATMQAQVDDAEQEYEKCLRWAAVLWGVGAPVGYIGKRVVDWTKPALTYIALAAKAAASRLNPITIPIYAGQGNIMLLELPALMSRFAAATGFFGLVLTATGLGYSEGEKARAYLEAAHNEILQIRLELSKASMRVNLREDGLRARSEPMLVADQMQRRSAIHGLWYKLLPDCSLEWSRLHGELGGEQLSWLPQARGLAPGWQQMPLDQIAATIQ